MRQSRSTSFLKSVISTAVGFGISLAAQFVFLPLLGVEIVLHQNLAFAAIMTVISVIRGYLLERFFEFLGWRTKLSAFMHAVLEECRRQRQVEGWSIEHDDAEHQPGELASAGAAYLLHAGTESKSVPRQWPWNDGWKPHGRRRDLVRGVALGIAEGEARDRDRKRGRP